MVDLPPPPADEPIDSPPGGPLEGPIEEAPSWAWRGRDGAPPAGRAPAGGAGTPFARPAKGQRTDLRPMGIGEVLDTAFALLRTNAAAIITITVLFVAPINVISSFLARDVFSDVSFTTAVDDPQTSADTANEVFTGPEVWATGIGLLSIALVLPFVAGAVCRVVAAAYLGDPVRAGPALRHALRHWVPLVVAWLVVHLLELAVPGLFVAALGLALVVTDPGVALGVLLAIVLTLGAAALFLAVMGLSVAVSPAIVEERLGPLRGVRRSWGLLRRRLVRTTAIAALAGLLATILGNVIAAPFQLAAGYVGGAGWVLAAIGGVLSQLVTVPFVAIVATLVYFDARIRREGFDLELMAAELAEPA